MSQSKRFVWSPLFIFLLLGSNSIQAAPSCGSSSGLEAISICKKALEKNPRDVDLRVDYADVLVKQKKYEKAVSVLRLGLQQNPSSTELKKKYRLAKSFVDENSGVQDLIARPPAAGTKSSVNAILCKKLKGKRALDSCNKLLKAEPSNVFALMRKGEELVILKQYEAAIDSYQKVLNLEPNNVSAKSQLIILSTKVEVRQPSVIAKAPIPVVKKPVPQKPVVKKPVVQKTASTAPVPVVKRPAVKKPVVEKPPVKKIEPIVAPVVIAALPNELKTVVFRNTPLSAGVTY